MKTRVKFILMIQVFGNGKKMLLSKLVDTKHVFLLSIKLDSMDFVSII